LKGHGDKGAGHRATGPPQRGPGQKGRAGAICEEHVQGLNTAAGVVNAVRLEPSSAKEVDHLWEGSLGEKQINARENQRSARGLGNKSPHGINQQKPLLKIKVDRWGGNKQDFSGRYDSSIEGRSPNAQSTPGGSNRQTVVGH